jgi:serine/threonine-protein kinase RsbW
MPDDTTAGGTGRDQLSANYPALPASVPAARAAVVEFATRSGASAATLEAVALAVSEATTNVVVHAYSHAAEPGAIEITAAEAAGELWVIVADRGSGLRPRLDSTGLGLGLGLIAQVSDGIDLIPRAAGGLELRMRFALAPA